MVSPMGRCTPSFGDQAYHDLFLNELSRECPGKDKKVSLLKNFKVNQETSLHNRNLMLTQDFIQPQPLDTMDTGDNTYPTNVDFFLRSDFNTTPDPEGRQMILSSWSSRHSVAINNVPWFLFQQQFKAHG
jgi:hypothetical protein